MNKLIRFGVSMEQSLLRQFDQLIAKKGYTNRSEALRDIVRNTLVEESVEQSDSEVYGALAYVYDHHKRELEKQLANFQHKHFHNIISTNHIHLDHDHCFEVILLRGKAKTLNTIANQMLSFTGVKHGRLTLTSPVHRHSTHHSHNH
jgi:CopG family transcriptional regulator, nickel-responsive regulator